MGSSGKSGGGATTTQTQEYKKYLTQWALDNPKDPSTLQTPGSYTGMEKFDESGYYSYKSEQQQKKLQEDMAKQQADLQASIAKMTTEQNTLLTQQRAETEAAQKEAQLQNQRSTRDSLFTERQQAEASSIDYVNSQIAKEKSNASLYGMKYAMTDEDKAARIADYFGTVWSADNENKLSGLMTEIGKPDKFTDFVLQRGNGATLPKTDPSSAAKSQIVSSTKGAKGKTGQLTSLLNPEDKESSTTLLGG